MTKLLLISRPLDNCLVIPSPLARACSRHPPDRCRRFGGVESLIKQPALLRFYELSTEERLQVGIEDSLIRDSVGIEDAEDLVADLEQALAKV